MAFKSSPNVGYLGCPCLTDCLSVCLSIYSICLPIYFPIINGVPRDFLVRESWCTWLTARDLLAEVEVLDQG